MAKRKTKQQKSPLSGKIRVFKAPMQVGRNGVTIVLPKEVLDYINADEDNAELYWSPVNGVIQISGAQPHMIIPMLSVNTNEFEAQEDGAPVVAED